MPASKMKSKSTEYRVNGVENYPYVKSTYACNRSTRSIKRNFMYVSRASSCSCYLYKFPCRSKLERLVSRSNEVLNFSSILGRNKQSQ